MKSKEKKGNGGVGGLLVGGGDGGRLGKGAVHLC